MPGSMSMPKPFLTWYLKKTIYYALEVEGYDSNYLDDLIDDANERLQYRLDSLYSNLGKDWKFSYVILDAEDIKGDDLDFIKDFYEDADVTVSAAKDVVILITIQTDKIERSSYMYVSLIKVGRSWYIEFSSIWDFL